ncbi:MAG: APC family permease [Conexivisphaerales archaeon]
MQTQLKKDALVFREVLFQGIAASAPAGAAVATLTGSATFALGSLPLATVLAFVLVLLNAIVINRISEHVAGAGGYYEYTKQGFGVSMGSFVGWVYIIYQVFALAFIGLSNAIFVPALLSSVFNINVPGWLWIPLLIATEAFGFVISYLGVKGSLRWAMVMGSLEMIVVVVIGLIITLSRPGINTLSVFTPQYAQGGISDVALGVLFAYTAFAGYGGATPLGEETKEAKRTVGRAVLFTSVLLGLFFIFAAYAFTVGWGPYNMGSYANALVPGINLAMQDIGPIAAIAITVFYINSILTDAVVFTNSASRVVFSMGRDRVLPASLSAVHKVHKTPHVSAVATVIAATFVAAVSVPLLGGGGFNAFLFTGVVSTLATLLVHMIVNAALPNIRKRQNLPIGLVNVLLPVITIATLAYVFYGTFISISLPVVVAAYLFTAWIVVGLIYIFAKRSRLIEVKSSNQ